MDRRGSAADRDDVRRVRAGDTGAFEGIVRRWQGPLVNLAYRYCRDPGRAEEMAQEAFLRVFRFLDRWREDSTFSTWLFAVATNVYRSEMRRVRLPEVPIERERPIPGGADPARLVETTETAEIVRRTVSTMPEKYRDALVLFYFRDMDLAETGRCLGVSEGTIKARLHRGRALLRRRLVNLIRPQNRRSAEAT